MAKVLWELAENDVSAGEVDRAIERYRQAVELDPNRTVKPEIAVAQSLVREAESYVATGSDEDALNAYRKAAEFAQTGLIVPEAELALQQAIKSAQAAHPEDAVMWLRQAVTLNPVLEQTRLADLSKSYLLVCRLVGEGHKSLDNAAICGQAASAAATTDSVSLNWQACVLGTTSGLVEAARPACSKTDALSQAIQSGETHAARMPVADDMAWYFVARALQSAQITLSSTNGQPFVAAVYSPVGTMLGQIIMNGDSKTATIRLDALPVTGTYRIIVTRSSVVPTIVLPSGISTLGLADTVSGTDIVYDLTLN